MAPNAARPKSYYYNRRLLAVVVGVMAFVGSVMFGIATVTEFLDWHRFGQGPTTISATDLVENGPEDHAFVRVTDLQIGPEHWQRTGHDHHVCCWVVAAPTTEPPLYGPEPSTPVRLVFVRFAQRPEDAQLAEISRAGEVTGIVSVGRHRLDGPGKLFFVRTYPGSDTDNAWVIEPRDVPTTDSFTRPGLLAWLAVIVFSVCAHSYLLTERAEREELAPRGSVP